MRTTRKNHRSYNNHWRTIYRDFCFDVLSAVLSLPFIIMVQTAPEQQPMSDHPVVNTLSRPQPADVSGNGCCWQCCGAAPPKGGEIDTAKILKDGGKFVQMPDGRVVEYFVADYSDRNSSQDEGESDAVKTILFVSGSMGTGRLFSTLPGLTAALQRHKLKALSITVPGFGYSSIQKQRSIGSWAKDDVSVVLHAEKITGKFMVEGASYGAPHAMAVAAHFGPERVAKLHLMVPYVSIPLREELGFKKLMLGDGLDKKEDYLQTLGSCSLSCQNSCLLCCFSTCPCCIKNCCVPSLKAVDQAVPHTVEKLAADTVRSAAGSGVMGWHYNMMIPTVSENWGFDPRGIAVGKIMISYSEDDGECDPAHGEFLGEWFGNSGKFSDSLGSTTCQVCKVNVSGKAKKMGHEAFVADFAKGKFVDELVGL